jgi:hypothetical protein
LSGLCVNQDLARFDILAVMALLFPSAVGVRFA